MNVNVAAAVLALGSDTVSVIRGTGAYVNGAWAPNPTSTFSLEVSAQNLRGRDLDQLPEEYRTREAIEIFTTFPLMLEDRAAGQLPDIVVYKSVRYQVQHLEDWSSFGYWRAIAVRVEV